MRFLFGKCTLDADARELTRAGRVIHVEPQVFDVLVHLINRRDHVVSKDELVATVWHGRIVSDSTLSSRINAARQAIGDTGEQQSFIRTVARRGFRFVGTSARSHRRRMSTRACRPKRSTNGSRPTAPTRTPMTRDDARSPMVPRSRCYLSKI
jgi:DNA-binding winged helix-turn-helix (wHTH) protein